MPKTITFDLPTKKTLNANNRSSNPAWEGVKVSEIRKMARSIGIDAHDDKDRARERMNVIIDEQNLISNKKRLRKKMTKAGHKEEEIVDALNALESEQSPETPSKDIEVDFMFKVFKVTVTVYGPTARKFDPPNFYPTIKAFVDGLTDSSWWDDDNFEQLVEMSFKYGGKSGIKGNYLFELTAEETS